MAYFLIPRGQNKGSYNQIKAKPKPNSVKSQCLMSGTHSGSSEPELQSNLAAALAQLSHPQHSFSCRLRLPLQSKLSWSSQTVQHLQNTGMFTVTVLHFHQYPLLGSCQGLTLPHSRQASTSLHDPSNPGYSTATEAAPSSSYG